MTKKKPKINVRLVVMGKIASELNLSKLIKWKSEIFYIYQNIENPILHKKGDLNNWGYSNQLLEKILPMPDSWDKYVVNLTFYILDTPLENDYITQILSNNRIVLTYCDIKQFLLANSIPLENLLLSNIYTYALLYMARLQENISGDDEYLITHDYSDGCIYDMCGHKEDIVASCISPIICEHCKNYLIEHNVSRSDIQIAENELRKIQRDIYYQIVDFLKKHPIISIGISSVYAMFLSVAARPFFNLLKNFIMFLLEGMTYLMNYLLLFVQQSI